MSYQEELHFAQTHGVTPLENKDNFDPCDYCAMHMCEQCEAGEADIRSFMSEEPAKPVGRGLNATVTRS